MWWRVISWAQMAPSSLHWISSQPNSTKLSSWSKERRIRLIMLSLTRLVKLKRSLSQQVVKSSPKLSHALSQPSTCTSQTLSGAKTRTPFNPTCSTHSPSSTNRRFQCSLCSTRRTSWITALPPSGWQTTMPLMRPCLSKTTTWVLCRDRWV